MFCHLAALLAIPAYHFRFRFGVPCRAFGVVDGGGHRFRFDEALSFRVGRKQTILLSWIDMV
nr:MAG TPA: hypothetical protein [Caudoviricetes sp.]